MSSWGLQCQKNLVRANRGLWAETLRSLERSGQLCGELYSGHYSELITAIQMVYRYWDGYAEMEESIGNRCPQFRQCIWSLLLPNLTEAGRREFFGHILPGFAPERTAS